MNKDRLIIEYPDTIPANKVSWIKNVVAANEHLKEIKITSNRQGYTLLISNEKDNPDLQAVDEYLAQVFSELAAKIEPIYKPIYPSADSGYEYHVYEIGEKCLLHFDGEITLGRSQRAYERGVTFESTVSLVRYATAVVFLTDSEKGGELVFPDIGIEIKPKAGMAVVFPPYGSYEHYVKECLVRREVVVTWFVYANINARLV